MNDTAHTREVPSVPSEELAAVRTALAAEYEVVDELGRGGMAVVYRARELQLGREVALKVLPHTQCSDPDFVERFLHEARTAARLEHPHIVPVYRVGRHEGVIFFAMKYVRGESLAARLTRQGQLPPPAVRKVLVEVGEALDWAAAHGVVHRDIKPENILIGEDGRCVVTDFGIAKSSAQTHHTSAGLSLGTPHYMSPEQARGMTVDLRSDLYSLGVVAYRCLFGAVPYDAPDDLAILYAHFSAPLPEPELLSADHEALYAIIRRLLQKDPPARIQSGHALGRMVRGESSLSEGAPVTVTAPALASPSLSRAHSPTPGAGRAMDSTPRGRAVRWVAAHRGHVVGAVVGIGILGLLGSRAADAVRPGRSLCPPAADSMVPAAGQSRPSGGGFFVLVDPPASLPSGSELEVHYDVCGLPRGVPFRTQLRLRRNEGGLKKLFGGGAKPVVASYEARADGPATRRRGKLDLDPVRPGGYTLEVTVTDNQGRQRTRAHRVQVTAR